MKPFTEYTDEQLAEWRADDITQAFIAWLRSEAKNTAQAVVDAVRNQDMGSATNYVGQTTAFDKAANVVMLENK